MIGELSYGCVFIEAAAFGVVQEADEVLCVPALHAAGYLGRMKLGPNVRAQIVDDVLVVLLTDELFELATERLTEPCFQLLRRSFTRQLHAFDGVARVDVFGRAAAEAVIV